MFILSSSISFACLVVTLLIPCIIPLWDSATAHSPSGKELKLSSLEKSCFSGLVVVNVLTLSCLGSLWFATHPYYSLNTCQFILSVIYFYSERPPLSIIFYSMCGLFPQRMTATLQRSVTRDFGGVSQIRLHFLFWGEGGRVKHWKQRNIMVYRKKVSHCTTFTLMIT